MTTFIPFLPPRNKRFQAAVTLDGDVYTLNGIFSVYGQRWYIEVTDVAGHLVFYQPLVGSPDPVATASLRWDEVRQEVFITTRTPHGVSLGHVAQLTVKGVAPAAFNGSFLCRSVNPTTLAFAQPVDPFGPASMQGYIGSDLNLAAGYFQASTLVFRESSQAFEVT